MVAPSWFPGPKPNHVISLCLKKLFVWKYVLLVHVQLSPGNPAIFFPSPRGFGSTHLHEASFLPKTLEKKPWFLGMAKISIPSLALPEMNPK